MLKAADHTIAEFEKGHTDDEEHVFIHGADPQFGFIDVVAGGDGLKWDEDIILLKKAIAAVNNMMPRPKFFFVNGDLINAFPGSGEHKYAQEDDVIRTLNSCEVPVLVSCGNHDIGNDPTAESVEHFKSLFGDDYYSFCVGKTFYIVLNSNYLYDPTVLEQQATGQMTWLYEQLKRAKSGDFIQTIVFMHIPPFTSTPDDEDRYYHLPRVVRHHLLSEFSKAGVQCVFSGHYHRNGGGFWLRNSGNERGDDNEKVEVVVSSAIGVQLGNDQSGLSVVNISKDGVKHKYYPLDDLPVKIDS